MRCNTAGYAVGKYGIVVVLVHGLARNIYHGVFFRCEIDTEQVSHRGVTSQIDGCAIQGEVRG